MEAEEAASEMLECARYGEPEDLLVMLTEFRVDVNHKDAPQETPLYTKVWAMRADASSKFIISCIYICSGSK